MRTGASGSAGEGAGAGKGAMVPLFVRIPSEQARRLDRASFERGRSKQALVSDMVERYLGAPRGPRAQSRRRHYTVEALEPEEMQVGHAGFRSYEDGPERADVLDAGEAAVLLKVERSLVERLAADGELPGRELGGEWRFARAALIEWLSRVADEAGAADEAGVADEAGAAEGSRPAEGSRAAADGDEG